MYRVLVLGAGKIGSLIAFLLAHSKHYQIFLADQQSTPPDAIHSAIQYVQLDATHEQTLLPFVKQQQITAVISALPFFLQYPSGEMCSNSGLTLF